jgi:hypothetical protein
MTEQATDIVDKRSRSPRRAIGVTLATLLVSWYCFPAAVDGWMSDHCTDGAFCSGLQGITEAVDTASRSVGVAGTLEGWRDSVRQALGIDFY